MISNKFRISMLIFAVWALSSLWAIAAYSQPLGFDGCMAHYASGASGWCQISDDVFENVRLSDAEANAFGVKGSIGSRAVMTAWNGAAFDPDSLTMYFHGGGHNDYYGNEWYAYDIQAGLFSRLNDPSPLTHYYYDAVYNEYCKIPDPALAPNSAHTYDGNQFNPSTGTIYMLNQGTSKECGPSAPADGIEVQESDVRNVYEFNPSPTETRNGLAPLTYRNLGRHYFTYPRSTINNGTLVFGSNRELYEYTIVNGQAVQGAKIFGPATAGQGFAESLNGEIVTYLNNGFLWTIDEAGTTRHIRNSPIPNHGGLACGVLECVFWSGAEDVTVWDRSAPGDYTVIDYATGPTDGDSRVYSKWHYIPSHDVYVGVSNVAQPVWLYRVSGSPVPPPDPDVDPDPVDPPPDPDPDFSDWMVDPDWSTFTVHPPVVGSQTETYSVIAGNSRFTIEIDKDVENGVYIFRAVGRADLANLSQEQIQGLLAAIRGQ